MKRACLTALTQCGAYSTTNMRKKKPFNPMLGSTFEMVTEEYRLLTEKVQHTPHQVQCFCLEGEDYRAYGYSKPKSKFTMAATRGMIGINFMGPLDFYFDRYDEHLTLVRPDMQIKNIIWGGVYCDFEGTSSCVNHKTGERVELKFFGRSGNKNSYLEGFGFDSENNKVIEISGSWLTTIELKDLRTGETE